MPSGSTALHTLTGRRVSIALAVSAGIPAIRVLSDSLTLYTFGGTIAGWAATASRDASIEVEPGVVRLAPFLPRSRLHAHTDSIDLVVLPGGAPIGELAIRPGEMWDQAGQPIAPPALRLALTSLHHMSVLEQVDATVRFEFTAQHRSGAHERWTCAIESRFSLVDHDAVLPDLWTLRYAQRLGTRRATLALYRPSVGAFRAILLDPASAAGLARWLSQTHAHVIDSYRVGFLAADRPTGFEEATDDELEVLSVAQLGEN